MAYYGAYSFVDCTCTIASFTGVLTLSEGGVAEEGITITPVETKNIMQTGADGSVIHNLIMHDPFTIEIRFFKTNPVNHDLNVMYNTQKASAATWGQNIIVINDAARGDVLTFNGCAFQNPPVLNFAKQAGIQSWIFDCANGVVVLGEGAPGWDFTTP